MPISWEDRNVKLYSQTELDQAIAQERERLRAELQHVRTVFRINMLRLAPETSHEEIDRVLSLESSTLQIAK